MANNTSLFDWQVVLLIFPAIVVIVLFCFLLWSDSRRDKLKAKPRK